MAKELNVSLPTLTSWMEKYEDFPIISRGRNGTSYKFSPSDVFRFLDQKKQAELEKQTDRDEKLASLQLSFANLFPEEEQPALHRHEDVKKSLDLARLRQLHRKEAEACGLLVPANDLRDELMSVLARLGTESRNFIKRMGIQNGIPQEIVTHKLTEYEDLQKSLIGEILGRLTPREPTGKPAPQDEGEAGELL
ncbi:hypothetical protein [Parasaccharibacter sp. TMW 2.1884]|uniref:hypothetical protein n=1 Tax=Parasaccharibacter sp. TMW 2.1884 TaxID=2267834 RepID=UPI0020125175|nr:hypothetical protein [Parasaccharibacter sp. TMW 2.1884]